MRLKPAPSLQHITFPGAHSVWCDTALDTTSDLGGDYPTCSCLSGPRFSALNAEKKSAARTGDVIEGRKNNAENIDQSIYYSYSVERPQEWG